MCGRRTRMLGCEHPGTRHDKYLDRLLIPERKQTIWGILALARKPDKFVEYMVLQKDFRMKGTFSIRLYQLGSLWLEIRKPSCE